MEIARAHHEKLDGSGYPLGMKAPDIPLQSKIMAIADIYDALTSDRPYRIRLSHAEAVRRLGEQAGRTLDPSLTALCIRLTDDAAAERAL